MEILAQVPRFRRFGVHICYCRDYILSGKWAVFVLGAYQGGRISQTERRWPKYTDKGISSYEAGWYIRSSVRVRGIKQSVGRSELLGSPLLSNRFSPLSRRQPHIEGNGGH
jgi:hypothetical protein